MSHTLFARRSGTPYKGLYEHTLKHGGATVDRKTGKHYDGTKGGYGIGMTNETLARVPVNAPRSEHHAAMRKAGAYPGATHLGTWLNDDHIDYDPSEIDQDRVSAEAKGRARNQKAIYDFKAQKDITL